MELAYNLKGAARKELGEVLTEYTGMECIYNGVPTCSYSVGDFTITKAGTLVLPEDWDDQDAEDLLAFLSAKGYHAADGSLSTNDEATTTEYTVEGLSVTIPADTMTDDAVINLENLLCAKGDLIRHTPCGLFQILQNVLLHIPFLPSAGPGIPPSAACRCAAPLPWPEPP